jgi:hypothetical protein
MVFAPTAFTTAAIAKHTHHRKHSAHIHSPAPESLTTVGTPDCHVQGRLLRMAHHCPPEAVAAARR